MAGGCGDDFVHAAADDTPGWPTPRSPGDEQTLTCVGFWRRAQAFFAAHGVRVQRVLTDNASGSTSGMLTALLASSGAARKRTRPYRPQTNGKVERFNPTLLAEWACVQVSTSNQQRAAALDIWLHTYNHHRAHTALGGHPPISRIHNAPGHYS